MGNSRSDLFLKKLLSRAIKNQSKVIVNRLPALKKSDTNKNNKTVAIDCMECTYFHTTWEKKTPYGCSKYGFKSAQIPSQVVFSSSGSHCLLFKPKLQK